MFTLSAKKREFIIKKTKRARKPKALKKIENIPAVLYGPEIKNLNLEINLKEFETVYKEAGYSSLINLNVEGEKKSFLVFIRSISRDPLSLDPIHIDFFQPSLKEEIELKISLVFEGSSPAVKDMNGTFVKNLNEIEVKGKPQDLPKEIKVNIERLKTFEDKILVKDLSLPSNIKVLRNADEIIAFVAPPQKVEVELAKTSEAKTEEVKVVEKKKKEEEAEEEEEEAKPQK